MTLGRTGKLLLVLDSTAILGFDSCGTHDHILLSDDSLLQRRLIAIS
jgi:hypothetical protein